MYGGEGAVDVTVMVTPPVDLSLDDQGEWLARHRSEMDCGECAWLLTLADFDRAQGWLLDGQLGLVDWLVWRTKMARGTAYEKQQVAHALARRPVVAAAFADGRLSYSATRAICRMEHPDPEVDEALVALAEAGTVTDVERAVRAYRLHADQHREPAEVEARRGVRVHRRGDGTMTIEVTLSEVEGEELLAHMKRAMAVAAAPPAVEPGLGPAESSGAVDDSAAAESTGRWLKDGRSVPQLKADALLDLARAGAGHLTDAPIAGDDIYMVHVVQRDGQVPTLIDGTPLPPTLAARLECDCAVVEHLVDRAGNPLWLGRRAPTWNTNQRRAIRVRDGGRCRWPGCGNRIVDIHHVEFWEDGGPTDVTNGLLLCRCHHTVVHQEGFGIEGDTGGPVRFTRPDGTLIDCA